MLLLSVELFFEAEVARVGGGEAEGREGRRKEKKPEDRLAKEGEVGGDSLMDGRRRLVAGRVGGAMDQLGGRKGRRKEARGELELTSFPRRSSHSQLFRW